MRKGISTSKVQRMRNLVTGNYNDKTKISSGYNKKVKEYSEGDVWEENGKQYTIKRGIKRTVSKTGKLRNIMRVPLTCPCCKNSMSHPAHKQMFKLWGMCLNCVAFWEQEMRRKGTYESFMKDFNRKNFNAYIKDAISEYNDWLSNRNNKTHVTEAGDIEEWTYVDNTDKLKKQFNKKVKKAKAKFSEENNGKINQ